MYKSLRPYVAEMIGTFALVFVGAGAVCARQLFEPWQFDVTGIALAQGLTLAVLLTATINVSGGFLNPAVTIVLWVLRRIDTNKLGWLLLAQFLGAILAGGLLSLCFFGQGALNPAGFSPPQVSPYGTPHVAPPYHQNGDPTLELTTYGMLTAAGVELVLTFLLTFAIFGTVLDPRTPKIGGLGVGLVMVALVIMGYNLTGAGVNPARCLGTFVWELAGLGTSRANVKEHVFVYWVGPIVGALLAGWVYTYLVMHSEEEERQAAIDAAAAHAHAHGVKK